ILIFHPACFLRTKRGLALALHRHVSWFVVARTGVVSSKQTRAAPNTSSGSAKAPRAASRLRVGLLNEVVGVPRRALEIQPYRGVGQCGDSKLRAHPSPPTGPVKGDAVTDVLVMAQLDAQAAVAKILGSSYRMHRGHGPGANQTQRGRAR